MKDEVRRRKGDPEAAEESKSAIEFREPVTWFDDIWNITLLISLYILQGLPMGMVLGSMPYLLQDKTSLTAIGIFSWAGYPYSLKLFWSPIVDSVYSKSMGRRKSWIVPIQLTLGIILYVFAPNLEAYMDSGEIMPLTVIFFLIVFLAATQDIAVDGWALTMLHRDNIAYASTCQSVGLNIGFFCSFTLFLAFSGADFCNTYIRPVFFDDMYRPDVGMVTFTGFLQAIGFVMVLFTVGLWLVKKEEDADEDAEASAGTVYKQMWSIVNLHHMKILILLLCTQQLGFILNDSVTGLKLMEKGFSRETMALIVVFQFPFDILFAVLIGKYSSGRPPLTPYMFGFGLRAVMCAVGPLLVYLFPSDGEISSEYFALVLGSTMVTSFAYNIMFVSRSAFFAQISDKSIGGTYMTLLHTLANFGGTYPKFFVMWLVDFFTEKQCVMPDSTIGEYSCVVVDDTTACSEAQGTCEVLQDGYFVMSVVSVVVCAILFVFSSKSLGYLGTVDTEKWKCA